MELLHNGLPDMNHTLRTFFELTTKSYEWGGLLNSLLFLAPLPRLSLYLGWYIIGTFVGSALSAVTRSSNLHHGGTESLFYSPSW